MKKLKTLFFTMCAITILFGISSFKTNNAIVEDDINAGWYVDGVKTNTLSCYAFDQLQLVVPYSSEWDANEKISIALWYNDKAEYGGVKLFSTSAVKTFMKGNYIVFSIINSEESMALQFGGSKDGTPYDDQSTRVFDFTKWGCAYNYIGAGEGKKLDKTAEDLIVNAAIYGLTQTEIVEKYDGGCHCVKKIPHYSSTKVSKSYKLTCTGRIWKKTNAALPTDPCPANGTKVDFNKLK